MIYGSGCYLGLMIYGLGYYLGFMIYGFGCYLGAMVYGLRVRIGVLGFAPPFDRLDPRDARLSCDAPDCT